MISFKDIINIFSLRKLVFLCLVFFSKSAFSSHAAGADIGYECLGGNNYKITLTFYRDCAGIQAPSVMAVKLSSVSCGYTGNSSIQILLQQQGPPLDVTPVCPSTITRCHGGNSPGIQKYTYSKTVTLPLKCIDWMFDWDYSARNAAIQTIANPGSQNLHVRATVNNLTDSCNNSIKFSNNPIHYVCIQNDFCFDHGVINPDGDSLVFRLITPLSSGNTTVTYNSPYAYNNPLLSNPTFPFTFDPTTGGICFNALSQIITIFAIEVKEYDNGVLVGSVIRDIQFYTIVCNNQNPVTSTFDLVTNVNNNNNDTSICAGNPLTFQIKARDPDGNDSLTMTWNSAIPGASFTVNNANPFEPVATFNWTPTVADIDAVPHCFTVDVIDDNCPFLGTFSFSYCITVTGISVDLGPDILGAPCSINQNTVPVVTGGVTPYTYLWSSGAVTPNNNLGCGPHSVTVTDNAGCIGYDDMVINCPQILLDTAFQNETCDGFNDGKAWVTASNGAGNYNYQWSNNGTQDTINFLSDGFYYVTVTDGGGCLSTSSLYIAPGAIPPDLFIVSGSLFCTSNEDTLVVGSMPGGTWSGQGLVTNGGNTYFSPSTAGVGQHAIQYTIGGACGATEDTIIEVLDPALQNVIKNNVLCYGDSTGQIQFNFLQADSLVYVIGNNTSTQISNTISNLPAGSYNLQGVWIYSIFCPIDSTIQITSPTELIPNFIFVNATCFDKQNGNIIANPSGGTSPYTYAWSTGNTTPNIINLDSGTYYLTVLDNNNCARDTSIRITKPAPFSFVTTSDSANCNQATGSAYINNLSGSNPPYIYTWDAASGNQTSSTAINLSPGLYVITISDNNSCDTIVSVDVKNKPGPTLTLSADSVNCNNFCDGIAYAVAAGGPSPGTYVYTWSTGANGTQINNLCAGNYTATVTDATGCTDTKAITIEQPDSLTITINPDTTICIGGTATILAQASGGTTPYTYGWINGWVGPGPHSENPTNFTCYILAITDANNCQSAPVNSCVNFYPSLVATASPDQTICPGETITLTSVANGGNPNNPITFSWDYGASINSFYQTSPAGTYPYSINYELIISDGCSPNDTDMVIVKFHEPKIPSFSPQDTTICPHGNVNFINTSTFSANICTWSYGDGHSSIGCYPTPHYTYSKPGNYMVTLTTKSFEGCIYSDTGQVHVVSLPVANFSINPNPTDIRNITFNFIDKSLGNVNAWSWYFYDNDKQTLLDSANTQNTKFDFYQSIHGVSDVLDLNDTGRYPVKLMITTAEGCIDDTIINAIVEPITIFFIPNTFTPNGDIRNEFFFPVMFGVSEDDYDLEIYNRWGDLLFRTNLLNRKWDGTAPEIGQSTSIVQDGVYIWKITFKNLKNDVKQYVGHVNVLK